MIKEEILKLNYKDFGYNNKNKFDTKIKSYLECKSDYEFLDKAEWDYTTSNMDFLIKAYELVGLDFTTILAEYNKLRYEIQRLSVCYLSAITGYKITSVNDGYGYSVEARVKLNKDDFMFLDTNATEQKLKALAKEHCKEKNGIIRGYEILEYYARVGEYTFHIDVKK